MKKKALDEIKTKDINELQKKLIELEKTKVNDLLELKMGKTSNVHSVKNKRKEIAQIKTIIKMKQLGEIQTTVDKKTKSNSATNAEEKQVGGNNATS